MIGLNTTTEIAPIKVKCAAIGYRWKHLKIASRYGKRPDRHIVKVGNCQIGSELLQLKGYYPIHKF